MTSLLPCLDWQATSANSRAPVSSARTTSELSLNRAIPQNIAVLDRPSPNSLSWRIRAWRSGRSRFRMVGSWHSNLLHGTVENPAQIFNRKCPVNFLAIDVQGRGSTHTESLGFPHGSLHCVSVLGLDAGL